MDAPGKQPDDERLDDSEEPGPRRSADERTHQDAGLTGGAGDADRDERVGGAADEPADEGRGEGAS